MPVRVALATLGGGATAMSVVAGWWWLAPLGLAAVAAGLHGLGTRSRIGVTTTAGLVHVAATSTWLFHINVPGAMLLIASQAAGWGLAGWVSSPRASWPWPFAAAMGLSEWVRGWVPFGGYPLSQLWLSQADGPLAALAPLVGPVGVTTVAAVLGAGLAGVLGREVARRGPLVVMAGLVAMVGWASLAAPPASTASVEVAAVQGGGPRGIPAVENDAAPLFERQQSLTRGIDGDVDLLVWPEGAVTVSGRVSGQPERELMAELASDAGAVFVTGLVEHLDTPGEVGRFANAAVSVDGRQTTSRYDKRIRVPFGEYVPAREHLGRIVDLSLVPRDALVGATPPTLDTGLGRLGVAISYEGMFARVAREAAGDGAELLVIPTNASSYVTDEVPDQQLAAARLRAREVGRDVVLNGPTGPTALVRADGTIVARAPLDAPRVVRGSLDLRDGSPTPYLRFGDTPIVGLLFALLLASFWTRLRVRAGAGADGLAQPRPSQRSRDVALTGT